MGALDDYKKAWADHRAKVLALRADYDKKAAALEQHKGSKYGSEKLEALEAEWSDKLSAARSTYGKRMSAILERMKDNHERRELEVVAPTDEQLRTLEAIRMMAVVTPSDYRRYAEQMEGSDIASRALHDIASERMPEGVKLPEYKGPHGRAWEQAKVLSAEAKNLARWDASTTRGAALTANMLERREHGQLMGLQTDTARTFNAAAAGDIDPTSPTFWREVIGGMAYDEKTLQLLD